MATKPANTLCSTCFFFKVNIKKRIAKCKKRGFSITLNATTYADFQLKDEEVTNVRLRYRKLFEQAKHCQFYDHFPWGEALTEKEK